MICVVKSLKIVIFVTLFCFSHAFKPVNQPVLEILQLSSNVTSKVENSWKNIKNEDYSGHPIQIVNRHRSHTFAKKSGVDNLIKNVHFSLDEQTLESLQFNDLIRWIQELNTIYTFYQDASLIQNADATTLIRKLQSTKYLRDKIRQLTTGNENRVQTLANSLKVISKFIYFLYVQ